MKKFLAVLLSLSLLLSIAACGSSDKDTSETKAKANEETVAKEDAVVTEAETKAEAEPSGDEEYTISVILKTTSSEYWSYVVAGAEAYGVDHPNVKVDVKGATSETAYDEQQNMIETDMSNAGIDGYVISPLQADMVANMIAGQTKPIVAVDTNIDAPEVLSFIGTGNEAAGKLGGEAAAKLAKERGWEEVYAIEIAGVQGDSTNEARMNGYKAGIEAEGGTFLMDEIQYANAVADQAVTAMEAIMQNHPEGIAIICANNDDMAMAAARAAAGNEAYKDTIFLGFDGLISACDSILNGELTLSVSQQGYEMGYKSVEAIVKALNGETLPEFEDTGVIVIDDSNAQDRKDQLTNYVG